jgi:FtsH-binding integral membrane protein
MNQSPLQSEYNNVISADMQDDVQRGFITRVYGWMAMGLLVTAAVAFVTIASQTLLTDIVTNRFLFFGLMIGELLLVMVLSGLVQRLSPAMAGLLFFAYAALNGVTLSILVLVYTASSIALTFGVTACTFGIMTLWGYTTHRDLTKMGSLLIMALIGMVLASVVNIFMQNSAIYWITTYLGILIFIGLIAYDTQKLKRMSAMVSQNEEFAKKASIIGALSLYLDFINLFLLLLRVLGGRRR